MDNPGHPAGTPAEAVALVKVPITGLVQNPLPTVKGTAPAQSSFGGNWAWAGTKHTHIIERVSILFIAGNFVL
jgi:hypothetical protein